MSLVIPDALEQNLRQLQTTLAQALSDLERLKARHALARATLSQHKHDWTRDITGQPATWAPATHTHTGYATDTHRHNYQDGQYTLKPEQNVDVARTTGAPV